MTKNEVLNETIEKINGKQGENVVVVAKAITSRNVQTQTKNKRSGVNNNRYPSSQESVTHTDRICQVRNLREDEIECKIATVKKGKGITLLLYKTARTDVLILDETFGKMNWQCDYKEIKGNMYCGISIFDKEKNQWVTKWDCGVESTFGDKQKGEASDAFKRAGFKWGIGIELYTAPFIWIPKERCDITEDGKCYDKFYVEKISIKDKVIDGLAIRNLSKENQRVFLWRNDKKGSEK